MARGEIPGDIIGIDCSNGFKQCLLRDYGFWTRERG